MPDVVNISPKVIMTVKATFCCVLLLTWVVEFSSAAASPAAIEYNRDVRPVLSENCFACHGADSASRKAKLRLDKSEEATAKREDSPPAIIPGKPAQSEAVRRIYDNGDDHMPPEKSHKVLTTAQKDLIKRWVADGAKYEPHWSLIAPVQPEPPKVKNSKWIRNPVDNFILARLELEKLKPAPEAGRRTLIRRVSLDLTGLPPQPEEVEAFVKDKSPDAYEKLVDRLLASPQWGEHRARYWLDAARYADTHGIHFDNFREMWTYRDWVIAAFNANMPFDQFTIEQLAGDLLPNATRDQQIASGFNRCNITSNEGGAIDEEYLVLYARDRTETTSQVWLGLTAGCAVCHDHKYDPLPQKEFYQLSAFFNNTTQKAMDGNVKDTPPVLVLPKAEEQARWEQLQTEIPSSEKAVEQRKKDARPEFDAWLAKPDLEALDERVPKEKLLFHAALDEGEAAAIKVQVAGEERMLALSTNAAAQEGAVAAKAFTVSNTLPALADVGDFERDEAHSYAVWVRISEDKNGALFSRMRDQGGKQHGWDLWLDTGRPAIHLVHNWPDDALKVIAKKELPKDRWNHVCVTYDGSSKAQGVKIFVNGEAQEVTVDKDVLKSSIRTESPFRIGERDTGSRVEHAGLQELNIFGRELKPGEVRDLAALPRLKWLASKPADARNQAETNELFATWLGAMDTPYQESVGINDRLMKESKGIRERGTVAHVMREREMPAEAYVLNRGEYDQRRDKVAPGTPAALPPMPADFPRNRLGFAKWLLTPEHPLTARVTVNRFWQEIFGAGIVKTAGDFGVTGDMPSHPELLDWLAVEFREGGWDMKRFFKLLVTSAAYRQAAVTTPEKLAKDGPNRLLSRGPRFRMDAEMIRDQALASSGLLVAKIGGPSVKPYQPDGIWEVVAMPESDTKKYRRDSGDGLYRRSLYTFWKRAAPPASLDIFNAPSRETCTVRRDRTDTPLQALVTLNDPQYVEAARHLAQLALAHGGADETARLDFMAERLLARPLQADERKIVESGLRDVLAHYQQSPKDAEALIAVGDSKPDATLDQPTLAAYTIVASQLMNLDEVLNK
jgi:Protein of unknown function (DUF1553)/Protein of unknown function (DUF1549)/Concanavalin A-like lectin/glucanases superfamily/Planctomycete cytochrome C